MIEDKKSEIQSILLQHFVLQKCVHWPKLSEFVDHQNKCKATAQENINNQNILLTSGRLASTGIFHTSKDV